jgi:GNAT superfamily N-acetyltransferase
MTPRVATSADLDAVAGVLTTAFAGDPLWGPAFPDAGRRAGQAGGMFRFFVAASLRYPWTFVTPGAEAAAVWVPPGGVELTAAEETALERLLIDTTGRDVAAGILAVLAQFDAARPAAPHHYLSLLGTHPAHRGHGLGMGLLAENLTRFDGPAYLESSNPANDARYARLGFTPYGKITTATGHTMTTMWREPSTKG